MRLLVLACLALAATACRHSVPPSGFGVDLTIDGTKLTERASVTSITISGAGAEPYFSGSIPAAAQIGKSGKLRVRYVPGVDAGSLAFTVDALDATGTVVGAAESPPVTLVPGHAVDVTITLADRIAVPVDMAQADLEPASCLNGVLDPGEVDIDCGGICARCEPGKLCTTDSDCATNTCLLGGSADMAVRHCELASSPPFWAPLQPLPAARSAAGAVGTSDGSIYAVGGITTAIETSTLVLSLATNTWTATGAMASPRAGMPVVHAAGKLFAIGGQTPSAMTRVSLASIESFDPATQVWSPVMHTLAAPTSLLGAALGGDNLVYAYGGYDYPDLTAVTTAGSFDPTADAAAALTAVTPLPVARFGLAGATDALGRVLAIGGLTTAGTISTAYDEVDVYDTTTKTWSAGPPLEVARGDVSAALGGDGRVYVVGGQTALGSSIATVEAISATSDHFTMVAPLSTARSSIAVTRGADGRVYAIGGALTSTTSSTTVEAYGPRILPGPATGPGGTAVAIAGSNFAANATVTINVSNGSTTMLAATGTTNVSGTLTPSPVWKVPPSLATGVYTLSATDDRARYTVLSSFEVK